MITRLKEQRPGAEDRVVHMQRARESQTTWPESGAVAATVLGITPHRRPGLGPVLASALGSFALSLLLLPRVPGLGDSAEFTLALALAGVPHPTGYPLYVLVGHPFVLVLHALGASWVTAANLWSAVGAAVAAGAYARLVQHLSAAGSVAEPAGASQSAAIRTAMAATPVLLLLLNPVWIASATVAEVYGWSQAWIAAAAAFGVGWLHRLGAAGAGPGDGAAADRRAALQWGVMCGLGAAHHATAAFFAVPLSLALIAALGQAGRWQWRFLLALIPAAAIPAGGALWIAWRAAHPAAFQWPVEADAASVWQHMRGAVYGRYLGRFAPRPAEWALIRAAVLPWLLPGLVLAAFHALRLPRSLRWGVLALVGGAALLTAFVVSYGAPDPAMYFVPALMVALLAVVPAMAWTARRATPRVAVALAMGVSIALASWSLPRAVRERARLVGVDARIRAAWRSVPFERGIVLWRDDHYYRLKLFQLLEGQRPGLYVDNPIDLAWPVRRAAFARRFGFDPLDGRELRSRDEVRLIPQIIARRSPLPVVDFPALIERQPRVP